MGAGDDDGRERRFSSRRAEDVTLIQIERDIKYLVKKMDELREEQRTNFVTRHEFEPVRMIVYGMVAIIMASVMVALLTVVISNS